MRANPLNSSCHVWLCCLKIFLEPDYSPARSPDFLHHFSLQSHVHPHYLLHSTNSHNFPSSHAPSRSASTSPTPPTAATTATPNPPTRTTSPRSSTAQLQPASASSSSPAPTWSNPGRRSSSPSATRGNATPPSASTPAAPCRSRRRRAAARSCSHRLRS